MGHKNSEAIEQALKKLLRRDSGHGVCGLIVFWQASLLKLVVLPALLGQPLSLALDYELSRYCI